MSDHGSSTRGPARWFTRGPPTCRDSMVRRVPTTACSAGSSPARSRPTWCTRPRPPSPSATSNPQAPTHVLVDPAQPLRRTPPTLAAAEPGDRGQLVDAAAAGRRASEGLTTGYRLVFNTGARRRPDRLPRPPARARRPGDGLAARLSLRRRTRGRVGALRSLRRRLRHRRRRRTQDAGADADGRDVRDSRRSTHADRPRRRRSPSPSRCARGSAGGAADARGLHARRRPPASAPTTTAASCSTRTSRRTRSSPGFVPPGNPRRRAPRDPVPGPARARSPSRRAAGCRHPGRGLDLLRRLRAARAAPSLDDAPWLGAWAPGRQRAGLRAGLRRGARRAARGSIMQVHYNLLGRRRSGPVVRAAPARAGRAPASRR